MVLLAACGGGGGSGGSATTNEESEIISRDISLPERFENALDLRPGEVVVFEANFDLTIHPVIITDPNNTEISFQLLSSRTGSFSIPSNSIPGGYQFDFLNSSDKNLIHSFSANLEAVSLPDTPENYVSSIKLDLITTLDGLITSIGDPDGLLTGLKADLESLDLSSLSDDEIKDIAYLYYVNVDSSFLGASSRSVGDQLAARGHEILSVTNNCIASAKRFTVSVIGAVASIPLATAFPPIGLPAFLALLVVVDETTGNVIEACPGDTADVLEAQINATGGRLANRTFTTSNTLVFLDQETKSVTFSINTNPFSDVQDYVDSLKKLVSDFSAFVPNIIEEQVNSLGTIITKDLTGETTLEQINTVDVICAGTVDAYQCGFPENAQSFSQPKQFEIAITTEKFDAPFYQRAVVQPRGVPVLQDKVFTVNSTAGSLLTLNDLIDPSSIGINDLAPIIDFVEVASPAFGSIVNENYGEGTIDYLLTGDVEISDIDSFDIKAVTKYGESNVANITIKYVSTVSRTFNVVTVSPKESTIWEEALVTEVTYDSNGDPAVRNEYRTPIICDADPESFSLSVPTGPNAFPEFDSVPIPSAFQLVLNNPHEASCPERAELYQFRYCDAVHPFDQIIQYDRQQASPLSKISEEMLFSTGQGIYGGFGILLTDTDYYRGFLSNTYGGSAETPKTVLDRPVEVKLYRGGFDTMPVKTVTLYPQRTHRIQFRFRNANDDLVSIEEPFERVEIDATVIYPRLSTYPYYINDLTDQDKLERANKTQITVRSNVGGLLCILRWRGIGTLVE